jgi:hypothetical protein
MSQRAKKSTNLIVSLGAKFKKNSFEKQPELK